jgi:hypothetical protein
VAQGRVPRFRRSERPAPRRHPDGRCRPPPLPPPTPGDYP